MVLMAAAAFRENPTDVGWVLQLRTREVRTGQSFQNKSQSEEKETN